MRRRRGAGLSIQSMSRSILAAMEPCLLYTSCRKAVVADLETQGYLVKTEPYSHNVGTRCV